MHVQENRFQLISQCRGCHAPASYLQQCLQMMPMPLGGAFAPTRAEALAAPKYPLTWVRCGECQLVQVHEDISDTSLFSQYNYASSTVPGLVRHFDSYAKLLAERYGARSEIHFLEIGCNDGVLLRRLPIAWRLTGVDPSDVARKEQPSPTTYELWNLPFTEALVLENKWESSIDVVSGSNCLAHISDLRAVFKGVHLALRPGGHFWVEVHDLVSLLDGLQWDTIYHEHKVEWSEQSLVNCMGPLGFRLLETRRLPLHGGLLRMCFVKDTAAQFQRVAASNEAVSMAALQRAYGERYSVPAVKILLAEQAKGEPIVAYGAAGRATVFLNQIEELKFDFIVDESPLRLGKFVPGTGTPIVPREHLIQEQQFHFCLITAWNYRADIEAKNPLFTGCWLTAFPVNSCLS